MNRYRELMNKQQEEANALPLGFAFSNKQFAEMMQGWGLTIEDTDKILRLPGGGFIQKKDSDKLHETLDRHDAELKSAIAGDADGTGFIYEMFLCELDDHEFGYTGDAEDALDALGYTVEQVYADERLHRGFSKAVKKIRRTA